MVGCEQEGRVMNWLVDQLYRFNGWYDGQREPLRFLLFITVMAFAVIPLQLGISLNSAPAAWFGGSLFGVMCFLASMRAAYLGHIHRYAAQAIIGLYLLVVVLLGLRFLL